MSSYPQWDIKKKQDFVRYLKISNLQGLVVPRAGIAASVAIDGITLNLDDRIAFANPCRR